MNHGQNKQNVLPRLARDGPFTVLPGGYTDRQLTPEKPPVRPAMIIVDGGLKGVPPTGTQAEQFTHEQQTTIDTARRISIMATIYTGSNEAPVLRLLTAEDIPHTTRISRAAHWLASKLFDGIGLGGKPQK